MNYFTDTIQVGGVRCDGFDETLLDKMAFDKIALDETAFDKTVVDETALNK